MKVLAINGSPRKNGNVELMLKAAEEVLKGRGVEVETLSLADRDVRPCDACERCYKRRWDCPIEDDGKAVLERMLVADGLLVGSPVYFGGVTAQLKALFDRSIMAYQAFEFRNKVGGAVTCGGAVHGGQEFTLWQIAVFFQAHDMIIANAEGGLYGAAGTGNSPGEVEADKDGLASAEALAKRMADLLDAVRR